MTALVLVITSDRESDDRSPRFTRGHLAELEHRFEDVVLVHDRASGAEPLPPDAAEVAHPTLSSDASLEAVLDSLASEGIGAAVIIDGDIRAVRRAGTIAKQHAVPALWWCDGPPAEEVQRATGDVIDAVLAPVDDSNVGRYLAIGAGIDTRSLRPVPLPQRPPIRILVLGRGVEEGGLVIPLRALAEARARGVDAHLLIVDSTLISSGPARRLAESLIADLMLTHSVELLDADAPVWLPDILRRVHGVIDVGASTEMDHVVLEAMACGRPVVSARPSLTPLLANESLPLVYATGDPVSLAACITALAGARSDELAQIGARLRARIDRDHSLPQWGASIASLVDALRAPPVS